MIARPNRAPLTDRQVDEIIGALLRYGVMLSASVVAAGGIWYLIQYGSSPPGDRVFRGEPDSLRHLRGIVSGIPGFHCRRMIQLGLVLLIATPVARVAFSVVAFVGGAAGSSGGGVTCGGVWCDPSVGCSIFGSVCMIAGSSSFFIQDR